LAARRQFPGVEDGVGTGVLVAGREDPRLFSLVVSASLIAAGRTCAANPRKQHVAAEMVLHILEGRFGPAGPNIPAGLAQLKEEKKFLRLALYAATCANLQDFEKRLREELPAPAPASTRGKGRRQKPST
jgi:hypothetical protein